MSRARARLTQILVVVLGTAVAGVMVFLGLWQMEVFQHQGNSAAVERTRQAPVALADLVSPGQEPTSDPYGRQVSFTGTYLGDRQVLIPIAAEPGSYRVLSALLRPDGSVVPVVRGKTSSTSVPAPPSSVVSQRGVFLASEAPVGGDYPAGQLGSVRLSALAQLWPQQLVPGFVTLPAELSAEQELAEAPLYLPAGEGRSRNAGYALQWWVFAAVGLGFCLYIARDISNKQRKRELVAAGLIEDESKE